MQLLPPFLMPCLNLYVASEKGNVTFLAIFCYKENKDPIVLSHSLIQSKNYSDLFHYLNMQLFLFSVQLKNFKSLRKLKH